MGPGQKRSHVIEIKLLEMGLFLDGQSPPRLACFIIADDNINTAAPSPIDPS